MKQTYNLTPVNLIGLEIFLATFTISIGALRFWILRHRRRTTAELISDILFLFSICVSTANVTLVCYKLFDEIQIRKKYTGLMVEILLFAPKYLKITYIMGLIYIIELTTMKGAFIAFYCGLFQGIDSRRRYSLHIVSMIVILSFFASMGIYLFWVLPISVNWSSQLGLVVTKAALASLAVNAVVSWLNIFTDLLIMGLPLLIISSLRLRRPEKIALAFIFCMGGLSIAASVSRFTILYPYIKQPPLTTQTVHVLELWGTVEMAAAVTAFSLPSLRVLYIRLLGLPSHVHVTPQGGSSGRSKGRKRSPKNTTEDSTLWTIGGGQIDPDGNRIVVKKTFDVHREIWPSGEDDLEIGSLDSKERVELGTIGVTVGGEGPILTDPTKRSKRGSAVGFGGYATTEVGSMQDGNISQERLRPAAEDLELPTQHHHPHHYHDDVILPDEYRAIQDSGDLLRRGNNASQIHLNDQGGLLTQGH